MNLQPYYKECKFVKERDKEISISEDIFNRGVCLPSDTNMNDEEIAKVIENIKELFIRNN